MTTVERRRAVARLLRPFDVGYELIRVGDFGDGGYLVPDDLSKIRACFSPGVSKQASFEMDLAKRGIQSFMADASVDGPAEDVPGAVFRKQHVGPRTERGLISLKDWIDECVPGEGELLLQMDIEAAEYPVFSSLPSQYLARFRIIVIELHRIPSLLMKPKFFDRAKPLLDAISASFTSVHIHTNNVSGQVEITGTAFPRVVEATFIRNDRVKCRLPKQDLPHKLDSRHNAARPDIPIPDEWVGL